MTTSVGRMAALLLSLSLVATLMAAVPVGAVQREDAPRAADSSTGRWIVLLDEPPIARYTGGIAGLAATAPEATGADRLDVATAASRAYRAHLEARQAAVLTAATAAIGRSLDVFGSYTVTLNGFAAEMSAAEAEAIAGLPGVARVGPDENRYLQTDNGPEWIGAPGVWDGSSSGGAGTKGEGVVVGVIDTGVNHDHPSFADVGGDGYDHTNPRGTFYGLCEPLTGLPFCNDKLIGVYDFTGTGPEDDNGHGSHTASTTAGNVVDAALVGPTITIERDISGVAPHANLITYKACVTTPAIGTCPISALLLAIDQATADMVDVVNFSIGGGSSDPWADFDAQAMLNGRAAGVFFSVSAGNEGPGASTTGSPADAPWVMAVGANTHDREFINTLEGMSGGGIAAPADMVGRSVTSGLESTPIVYAGDYGFPLCGEGPANAGTGEAAINPFPPGTFNGEIVVCDRGTYGRVEKAQNVMEGGAGGYVLANDQPSGDSTVADAYPIPGVNIGYDDGVILKAWLASGGGHVAAIGGTVANEDPALADVMASFSSRGPNPASGDILKPDVTAPGVDILAAFHTPLGSVGGPTEFGVISGTSMSSPHAAGSAALVRALHPDWSPAEVQSALMTTSFTSLPGDGREVHGVLKEDGATAADPFDMGAGRVNLHAAGRTGLVLDETAEDYAAADPALDGDPTTINTASLADGSCAGTCGWHRTLTGTAPGTITWTASVTEGDLSLAVEPATFDLAAGQDVTIAVTADITAAPADVWQFGTVTLTPSDASVPAVHLPVAAFPAPAEAAFDAPVLEDPGETSTTGDYGLTWSDLSDEIGYEVQQAADLATAFSDDAEAGMAGRWTTEAFPGGWSDSIVAANSGSQSYWSGQADERTSTLTLAEPISVPAGAEATVRFASYEDTEPGFDYGYVEGSADGGETWERFLTINGFSDGFVDRAAVLRGLSGDVLVRFSYVTDQLVSAPLYQGWYVDDIEIEVGTWETIGETGADETTFDVTDQPSGTYHHRVAGRFETGGANATLGPWSNVVDIVVDAPVAMADLQVTDMSASNGKARAGDKVSVSATITNAGDAAAEASSTSFALEDGTAIGTAATPALDPGSSATVTVTWDTRGVNGERVIVATADAAAAVEEGDEDNNVGRLTVTIRGNKVSNGSFEQSNADGTAPADWTASSSKAGTTSYGEGGSDGERSVSITGTGASAVLHGVPSWTSAPIAVKAGEVLSLRASVRTDGLSSAPSIGLAYLGPTGELLKTVTVATAALRTDGFAVLDKVVTIPTGVVEVRVVLAGFAATDLATRGTVTFDDVGLYAE